jgi:glycosyltransferase involved in cell wall biosynthesis
LPAIDSHRIRYASAIARPQGQKATEVKVLFVVNNAAFFCSHRLPIALALRAAGHEVALVTGGAGSATLEEPAKQELAALGLAHTVLAFSSGGANPLREFTGLMQLLLHVRRLRPDLVHCASPKALLYGGLAARAAGVRGLVLAISGMGSLATPNASWRSRVLRAIYGHLVKLAYGHRNKRVIVQNGDDRAAVLAGGLASTKEVVLIPGSGVDLAPLLAAALRPRENIVLLPARMLREKGVEEFVLAARQLRDSAPGWRFVLAGTADYINPSAIALPQLQAWVQEGVVEWWGNQSDMPSVMGRAQIVCLPSWREGMPKALLEAAVAGCAVVTTDAIGCREAIVPGVTGDLVPVKDVPALTRTLHRLIHDPDRRLAYASAGREYGREHFGIQRVIDSTISIYAELLQ